MVQADMAGNLSGHYKGKGDVVLRVEFINPKHSKVRSMSPQFPGKRDFLALHAALLPAVFSAVCGTCWQPADSIGTRVLCNANQGAASFQPVMS